MIGWASLIVLGACSALLFLGASAWYFVPFLAAVAGVGYGLSRHP